DLAGPRPDPDPDPGAGTGPLILAEGDPLWEVLERIGKGILVLHAPSSDGADRLSGGDVDCAVRGMDRSWPLRLPPGWRLCQRLQYDLRGWTWILERDGHVVWVDTSEDPLGLAREGFPTSMVGRGVAEAEGPVRAAYLTAKRLNK